MPEQFWELTPAELNLIIECNSQNKIENYKNNITYAFYAAYFNLKGQKSLSSKDLKSVLDQIDKQEIDDEGLFKKVVSLNSRFGGEH